MSSAARIWHVHEDALLIRARSAHRHPSCPHPSIVLRRPRQPPLRLFVSPNFISWSQQLCSFARHHFPNLPFVPLQGFCSMVSIKSSHPLICPPLLPPFLSVSSFLRQFVSSRFFPPCSLPLSPYSPNPASPQGVNGRCDRMVSKRRSSVSVNDCQLGQTYCPKSEKA